MASEALAETKEEPEQKGKGESSEEAKPEPTAEQIQANLKIILKQLEFEIATLSTIQKQVFEHFGVDLMHRKAEIKAIITEVFDNMSDMSGDENVGEDQVEQVGDGENDEADWDGQDDEAEKDDD